MINLLRWLLLFILCSLLPLRLAARETIQRGDVVVLPLKGEISSPTVTFLRRGLKAAEAQGASALVIEMNTYGGRLDSAEEITSILGRAKLPTSTFVNSNAGSAGALIALATRHIYMAPVSAIGAAAPVLANGADLPTTERDKTVSYWSALIRNIAAANGHNPDIGEAFLAKEKEVKIGSRVVHAKGSLLTLNSREASERIDGTPVLAEGIVSSPEDLAQKQNLRGRIVAFAPSGFERLAWWLTDLAPLLLIGGILGAYLEFKLPGTTLPGVIAAICFTLFFLGHHLAGLAGWEVAGVFIVGVAFVLIEVLFFAHSTILFGVVGVFLMLGSLLWAMIDRYPGETLVPTGSMLARPVLNLLLAIAGSATIIALLARMLPRTSLYQRFVLSTASPSGPSRDASSFSHASSARFAPGSRGISVTMLRPSGKALFDGTPLDVVTGGEFIEANVAVEVVRSDGMRVVVAAS